VKPDLLPASCGFLRVFLFIREDGCDMLSDTPFDFQHSARRYVKRMFENKGLKRIYALKRREEVTGFRRNLHNEEFSHL
jgi:hypothetical protein